MRPIGRLPEVVNHLITLLVDMIGSIVTLRHHEDDDHHQIENIGRTRILTGILTLDDHPRMITTEIDPEVSTEDHLHLVTKDKGQIVQE